ncbi:methyltransferase domain-containing protein [Streptodolium elevatio]|uniref:Methyltransferase domain-containing protein n=1 Tax=Streptodolium elevatio TaxID=3157996 RepID=A0ABV3D9K2_9ACTN
MSSADEPIHQRLLALAAPRPGEIVVDLGCGAGPTLSALALAAPGARLLGIDRSEQSLRAAVNVLKRHIGGRSGVAIADLRDPLPLLDGSVDVVLSYNTVECVPDPVALLHDVARVLRPGGRLVLAHVDFDSLIIAGADADLDRRVCHAYADLPQPWMDNADGRVGRKLPGLVRQSSLRLTMVESMVSASTELDGHAAERVDEVYGALRSASRHGTGVPSLDDVERWRLQVSEADVRGTFYFTEVTVIAVAERP